MGRLQNDIAALVEDAYLRGVDGDKVARRLIEAGLANMVEADQGSLESTVSAWNGALPFYGHMGKKGIKDIAFGNMPTRTTTTEHEAALRFAAEMFDGYARHHLAKQPADIDKAHRNIEAASKMFQALGEDYLAPEVPSGPGIEDAEGWKQSILADSSPVGRDSGPELAGTASRLVSALHIAELGGEPTLGVRVHLEDQPIMATLVETGYLTRDEVSDKVTVTTKGKDFIGVRPDGVPELVVTVEDAALNVPDSELAARYIEAKIKGIEKWIAKNAGAVSKHDYEVMARVLTEIANEFRVGLHLPDDEARALCHAEALRFFFQDVHGRNVKAGWWTDIQTGQPKLRNLGELLMLFVTEMWEAYDAYINDANDDKLPDYPGLGVELADLGIRWADLCGALAAGRVATYSGVRNPGEEMFREVGAIAERYELIRKTPEAVGDPESGKPMEPMCVGTMTEAKLYFNAHRADHKIENRLKDDGKKT